MEEKDNGKTSTSSRSAVIKWKNRISSRLRNRFNFGGLFPPVHVQADIRRTRLLGTTWVYESGCMMVRARDDMPVCHWDGTEEGFMLDVRNPQEIEAEAVPGAVNIPLPELRERLGELPREKGMLVISRSTVRACFATRILMQNESKQRRSPAVCLLVHIVRLK